jgi:hypothetical protein
VVVVVGWALGSEDEREDAGWEWDAGAVGRGQLVWIILGFRGWKRRHWRGLG